MIRTDQLTLRAGDFLLDRVTLQIAPAQYFVLLGPPGSGKSLFLECLCGLRRIDSGSIQIAGRDVTCLEPRQRRIGYVPQDYALFPHLSVEENIAFGLRGHAQPKEESGRRIAEAVAMLGLKDLLRRRLNGLSGGERQRVALARALVLRPEVLLLDEPVSALDESTRQEVCEHLLRLQRQLALTTVHVSHNLEEAFSLADTAGILEQGRLKQVGTMAQLLRQPRDQFVARFMRCENVFQATARILSDQESVGELGPTRIRLPGRRQGRVCFMIRPEDLHLFRADRPLRPELNELPTRLVRARDCGNYMRLTLEGELDLVAHLPRAAAAHLEIPASFPLAVRLHPEYIHVMPELIGIVSGVVQGAGTPTR